MGLLGGRPRGGGGRLGSRGRTHRDGGGTAPEPAGREWASARRRGAPGAAAAAAAVAAAASGDAPPPLFWAASAAAAAAAAVGGCSAQRRPPLWAVATATTAAAGHWVGASVVATFGVGGMTSTRLGAFFFSFCIRTRTRPMKGSAAPTGCRPTTPAARASASVAWMAVASLGRDAPQSDDALARRRPAGDGGATARAPARGRPAGASATGRPPRPGHAGGVTAPARVGAMDGWARGHVRGHPPPATGGTHPPLPLPPRLADGSAVGRACCWRAVPPRPPARRRPRAGGSGRRGSGCSSRRVGRWVTGGMYCTVRP